MNVNLSGIDLNPVDWFVGSNAGDCQAAANAWNPAVNVSTDMCTAFISAYHDAVINGKNTKNHKCI